MCILDVKYIKNLKKIHRDISFFNTKNAHGNINNKKTPIFLRTTAFITRTSNLP